MSALSNFRRFINAISVALKVSRRVAQLVIYIDGKIQASEARADIKTASTTFKNGAQTWLALLDDYYHEFDDGPYSGD